MWEISLNQTNKNLTKTHQKMKYTNKQHYQQLKKSKQLLNQTISYDYHPNHVPPLLDLSINSFVQDDSISIDLPHSQQIINNNCNPYLAHSISFASKQSNVQNHPAIYKTNNQSLQTTKTQSKDQSYQNFKEEQYNIQKKHYPNNEINYPPSPNIKSPPSLHPPQIFKPTKKKALNQMSSIAMQIYQQQLISQQFPQQHSSIKKNPFNKKQTGKQLLATLLTNPLKLQKFLQYLIQSSLTPQQQHNQTIILQQQMISSYSKKQFNKSKKIKQGQIGQILACLLVKIRQSSLVSNQTIPNVFISGKGDISFDFGQQSQLITFLTRQHKSNLQSCIILNERNEKIRQLNQKLNQKNNLVQYIKQQYDRIICNFATVIHNIKNKHQRKSNKYPKKQQHFLPTKKQQDNCQINQQNDKQLKDLIQGSKNLDTQTLFQRLSRQSKSKNKRKSRTPIFQYQQ